MKNLTKKQITIYEFIDTWQTKNGYPPTQEEIRNHFGFSSINAVRSHLALIEKKGYIKLNYGKARGIRLTSSSRSFSSKLDSSIPLVGNIAAGVPIWAEQNIEDYLPVSPTLFGGGDLFALNVLGDSMIDVGINSGDIAIIKKSDWVESGEIAAVLIEQEATLKRVFIFSDSLLLKSENAAFSDLKYNSNQSDCIRILGHYQGIIRINGKYCS